jgi:hypothetical protein
MNIKKFFFQGGVFNYDGLGHNINCDIKSAKIVFKFLQDNNIKVKKKIF